MTAVSPPLEVVTLGETMIRYSPPGYNRLEDATELEMRIGGSESNVAIGLARMGVGAAWVSKLPRHSLGQFVARRVRSHGVNVDHLIWSDTGRVGLYFVEPGAAPRPSQVLYDRANSAASTLAPDEVDWSILDAARHLHLSGITPALSESCRQTVLRGCEEARRRGKTVSFDVNYRARLWSPEAAREAIMPILPQVDLLICTETDARLVLGLDGAGDEMVRALLALSGARAVALTLGGEGAVTCAADEVCLERGYAVSAIDRVGAGDAFDAGLIWGYLQGDLALGLRYGTAMAALKHSIPGDEFLATRVEVEAVLASGSLEIQR